MYIASISHGKDSIAMLHVIKDILHLPLDRIITVDVWFDDETRAELPPMVKWKDKADKIIEDKWGIPVEHLCATRGGKDKPSQDCSLIKPKAENTSEIFMDSLANKSLGAIQSSKLTYKECFYRVYKKGVRGGEIQGFPISINRGNYCTRLKHIRISNDERELVYRGTQENKFLRGNGKEVVQYLGIASDEPKRIERHSNKDGVILPLVEAKWTEQMCYEWCEKNDLLAPTYTTSMRDGCWFCHNQGVNQLRNLYHNYPELWNKLLQLDKDSPVTFHADGHTVHDFDRRFKWEDEGYKSKGKAFRWSDLDESQMNIYQFMEEE